MIVYEKINDDFSAYFYLLKEFIQEILVNHNCNLNHWDLDSNINLSDKPSCNCFNSMGNRKFMTIDQSEDVPIIHTGRGLSVNIEYFTNTKYSILQNLTKIYPLNKKKRDLRFLINAGNLAIHRDYNEGSRMYKQIMFPLINCDNNVKTVWWDLISNNHKNYDNSIFKGKIIHAQMLKDKAILKSNEEEFIFNKVDETWLQDNQPTYINVGTYHSVINISKKPRVVVGMYVE